MNLPPSTLCVSQLTETKLSARESAQMQKMLGIKNPIQPAEAVLPSRDSLDASSLFD